MQVIQYLQKFIIFFRYTGVETRSRPLVADIFTLFINCIILYYFDFDFLYLI